MQHCGWKVRQMNWKVGQQHTSPDAEQKNYIRQWPGINSSVRKPLLLIYKDTVDWWDGKIVNKWLPWLIQTVCPKFITPHIGKQSACFEEFDKSATEFDKSDFNESAFNKSATELKPKPKLCKCKNIANIATFHFHVRTFNSVKRLPELRVYTDKHNVDVICMR